MTDTTTIRTYATDSYRWEGGTVQISLPDDWMPGTPVLVVAGLPEGANLLPRQHVPMNYEYMTLDGTWRLVSDDDFLPRATGLVACRPKPAPVTERVPWHEAVNRRTHYDYKSTRGTPAEIRGALFDDPARRPHGFVVDVHRNRIRDIDADGMVEVLRESV